MQAKIVIQFIAINRQSNITLSVVDCNLHKIRYKDFNSYSLNVKYPKSGDFFVDGKYTFEIGGKNKTEKQIAHLKNSLFALDDIEYGYKIKIPLWLFGFLY